MSDTAKQSPLGVNSFNAVLLVKGLRLNPVHVSYVGTSQRFATQKFTEYTFGKLCANTVLRMQTYGINAAYFGNTEGTPTNTVYNNLINIGGGIGSLTPVTLTSLVVEDNPTDPYYDFLGPGIYVVINFSGKNTHFSPGNYLRINGADPAGYNGNWLIYKIAHTDSDYTLYIKNSANYELASNPGTVYYDTQIPALGNSKSLLYTWEKLIGPYGSGTDTYGLKDKKGWGGSLYKNNTRAGGYSSSPDSSNYVTQWGFIRLFALQAWQEFNYNSTLEQGTEENPAGYRDFLQSFQSCYGFMSYTNDIIIPVDNSSTFLKGTYSNINDLISADVSGVSLATKAFGQDLIASGKAINLEKIDTFGLPSNLLKTLVQYNALTKNVSLAIIASGIPTNELGELLGSINPPTIEQEQKLYAAFCLVVGDSLTEALIPLNCKTQGLESLADLLNPKKLFPNSYSSLTVPLYNASQQLQNITNSKTYYLIYKDGGTNPQLTGTQVLEQIGVLTPLGEPPIIEKPANIITDTTPENITSATNITGRVTAGSLTTGIGSAQLD